MFQGDVEGGTAFFRRLWPEARAVSDPKAELYTAFGIKQGGWRELLAPDVVACGVRAAAKGQMMGTPAGDTQLMPGLFLVEGENILWKHDFTHIGDHPDFAKIPY